MFGPEAPWDPTPPTPLESSRLCLILTSGHDTSLHLTQWIVVLASDSGGAELCVHFWLDARGTLDFVTYRCFLLDNTVW